jgi:exonuclease SbcD
LGVGNTLNPLEALTTYLNNREDLKDIHKELLAAAEGLLASL